MCVVCVCVCVCVRVHVCVCVCVLVCVCVCVCVCRGLTVWALFTSCECVCVCVLCCLQGIRVGSFLLSVLCVCARAWREMTKLQLALSTSHYLVVVSASSCSCSALPLWSAPRCSGGGLLSKPFSGLLLVTGQHWHCNSIMERFSCNEKGGDPLSRRRMGAFFLANKMCSGPKDHRWRVSSHALSLTLLPTVRHASHLRIEGRLSLTE